MRGGSQKEERRLELFEVGRRNRNRPGFHLGGQRKAPLGIANGLDDHLIEARLRAVARAHQGERLFLVAGVMAAAFSGDRRQAHRPVLQVEAAIAAEIDEGLERLRAGVAKAAGA